jgi:hypothetical protein
MASGLRGAFTDALPRPMYRITCPSRARLHARSQVLAMHRGLMHRITGHYPIVFSGRSFPEAERQLAYGPREHQLVGGDVCPGCSDDDTAADGNGLYWIK